MLLLELFLAATSATAFLLSLIALLHLLALPVGDRALVDTLYTWIGAGIGDSRLAVDLGLALDLGTPAAAPASYAVASSIEGVWGVDPESFDGITDAITNYPLTTEGQQAKESFDAYVRDVAGGGAASELEKAATLHAAGSLSDEEYAALKSRILS